MVGEIRWQRETGWGTCVDVRRGASLEKRQRKFVSYSTPLHPISSSLARISPAVCGKDSVKRDATGIWTCKACRKTVAGGAYTMNTVSFLSSTPCPALLHLTTTAHSYHSSCIRTHNRWRGGSVETQNGVVRFRGGGDGRRRYVGGVCSGKHSH